LVNMLGNLRLDMGHAVAAQVVALIVSSLRMERLTERVELRLS